MIGAHPNTVAIALGDPNGVGPEIAVKAAKHFADNDVTRCVLVGDEHVVRHYATMLAPGLPLRHFGGTTPDGPGICLLPVDALGRVDFVPGRICAAAGRATVDYLATATRLVTDGGAQAIVGCPHSETAVNASGIPFSGYPGLLARLLGVAQDNVFLMLVGAGLRIVHVTLHERLQTALARLSPALIEDAAVAGTRVLEGFGISQPRVGLFGINPHAGEGGLFGDDDDRITKLAAERLRARGLRVEGPTGADLLLGRRDIDLFVAMYHDQGHIPIKLLAGRNSAALSIGAGVVLSSVGHGCAFDIAGRGVADPGPVLRAIALVLGRPTPELATRAA